MTRSVLVISPHAEDAVVRAVRDAALGVVLPHADVDLRGCPVVGRELL